MYVVPGSVTTVSDSDVVLRVVGDGVEVVGGVVGGVVLLEVVEVVGSGGGVDVVDGVVGGGGSDVGVEGVVGVSVGVVGVAGVVGVVGVGFVVGDGGGDDTDGVVSVGGVVLFDDMVKSCRFRWGKSLLTRSYMLATAM